MAPVIEDCQKSTDNFLERRAMAIAAKAQEIEKVHLHSLTKISGILDRYSFCICQGKILKCMSVTLSCLFWKTFTFTLQVGNL